MLDLVLQQRKHNLVRYNIIYVHYTLLSIANYRVLFLFQDLLDKGVDDVDMETGQDTTAGESKLHMASLRGNLEEVKRLTEEKHLNPLQKD